MRSGEPLWVPRSLCKWNFVPFSRNVFAGHPGCVNHLETSPFTHFAYTSSLSWLLTFIQHFKNNLATRYFDIWRELIQFAWFLSPGKKKSSGIHEPFWVWPLRWVYSLHCPKQFINIKLDKGFTEHDLAHQNKNQFPLVSLSPQEASISLLSLPIRQQTEWKPWSQKTNQTIHMDHSLV